MGRVKSIYLTRVNSTRLKSKSNSNSVSNYTYPHPTFTSPMRETSLSDLPPEKREKYIELLLKHNASFTQDSSGNYVTTLKIKRKNKSEQKSEQSASPDPSLQDKSPSPIPRPAQRPISSTPSTRRCESSRSSYTPTVDPSHLERWASLSTKYPSFCQAASALSDSPEPSQHCASLISKARTRAPSWLRKHIDGIYDAYWTAYQRYNKRLDCAISPPFEVPLFCIHYIKRTLGLPKLVLQNCVEFLVNLDNNRSNDADFEVFGCFFEEFYSQQSLVTLLSARNACGKADLGSKLSISAISKGIKSVFRRDQKLIDILLEKFRTISRRNPTKTVPVSVFYCVLLENLAPASPLPQAGQKVGQKEDVTRRDHDTVSSDEEVDPHQSQFIKETNQPCQSINFDPLPAGLDDSDSFASRVKKLQQAKEQLKMIDQSNTQAVSQSDHSDEDENFNQTVDDYSDDSQDIEPAELEIVAQAASIAGCKNPKKYAELFLRTLDHVIGQYCHVIITSALDHVSLSENDYFGSVFNVIFPQIKEAVSPIAAVCSSLGPINQKNDHSDQCKIHLEFCRTLFEKAINSSSDAIEDCVYMFCKSLLNSPDVRNLIEPSVAYIISNIKLDNGLGSPSLIYKSKEFSVPNEDCQGYQVESFDDSDWLDLASEAAVDISSF
ncbi:hypothetical protein P9112_004588 [Eukaryota sp. TZLM1-RC]